MSQDNDLLRGQAEMFIKRMPNRVAKAPELARIVRHFCDHLIAIGFIDDCCYRLTTLSTQAPLRQGVPSEVWVVVDKEGADFVAEYRQGAMDHALDRAERAPELGPVMVQRYIAANESP